jgi:hypothetical protein
MPTPSYSAHFSEILKPHLSTERKIVIKERNTFSVRGVSGAWYQNQKSAIVVFPPLFPAVFLFRHETPTFNPAMLIRKGNDLSSKTTILA